MKFLKTKFKDVFLIKNQNHSDFRGDFSEIYRRDKLNQKVGYGNDLETNFPEIAKQWDYKKNDLKPNEVLPFSHKKVWWLCPEKHSYQQTIAAKNNLNQECSYCTNQKAGYGNDLQTNYPELVSEWDFKRNIKKLKINVDINTRML